MKYSDTKMPVLLTCLCRFTNSDGVKSFVLLQADKKNLDAIKTASHMNRTINFESYGRILFSSIGTPDSSLINYFEASYGTIVEI